MLDFSNMQAGFEVTALGMAVVFAVLIIIAGVISLCAKLIMISENIKLKQEESKAKKTAGKSEIESKPESVEKKPEPVAEPVANIPATSAQDLELIAVITAAIAMQTGKGVDDLVVRSIRRVKSWNKDNYEQNLF